MKTSTAIVASVGAVAVGSIVYLYLGGSIGKRKPAPLFSSEGQRAFQEHISQPQSFARWSAMPVLGSEPSATVSILPTWIFTPRSPSSDAPGLEGSNESVRYFARGGFF